MSIRTLSRRFREQTGTTPLQWLLRARVRRAQRLLETTKHVGGTRRRGRGLRLGAGFREHFRRLVADQPAVLPPRLSIPA